MDWAQILVFLLAALFAVFLIVAIILAVMLLKVTRQIKSAAASAERTVQALENSVGTFNKAALPLMVTKSIVGRLVGRSKRKSQKAPDSTED